MFLFRGDRDLGVAFPTHQGFQVSLGLALGSPIFNSSCDGKLGVLLESLQGQRDLIEACVQDLIFLSREDRDHGFPFQTPPGGQDSPGGEAKTPLSSQVATRISWSPCPEGFSLAQMIRSRLLTARVAAGCWWTDQQPDCSQIAPGQGQGLSAFCEVVSRKAPWELPV